MNDIKKFRVAIIGAGASGLVSIKCCIEDGLEPVCFEKQDIIGGLWNYKSGKGPEDDQYASVMKSTVINTSKEMMCFSDFLIPDEFPNFMHHRYVLQYFHQYANKFDLKKYIKFNTTVKTLEQSHDFEKTGCWKLSLIQLTEGKNQHRVEYFDAVLVCTGHHATKHIPQLPGINHFKGQILHSQEYKTSKDFEDKNILVIGIGNSGGDAAVDLSHTASHVFLSTRRGSWIINRIGDNGIPSDLNGLRRIVEVVRSYLPRNIVNYFVERKLNTRFDHAMYGLKPNHRFDAQHPMINDELPNKIASGKISVRDDIKRFTQNGIVFQGENEEHQIDAVILATGYKFGYPFIDKKVIDVKNNEMKLFKYEWIPDLSKQTIGFIGCIQPVGAIMPISELQARWATRVFSNKVALPSCVKMQDDIQKKSENMTQRYVTSPRHTIQVDWISFMDELASFIGCKPNILELLKTDWKLGWKCLMGPCTPPQYRLTGPNKWPDARRAIFTTWDRVCSATKTRQVPHSENTFMGHFKIILLLVVAYFIISYLF